jgi:cytochrome P450
MALHIVEDPELYQRVRTEINAAGIVSESAGKTNLDKGKFQSLPLLLSIYQECLRRYTSLSAIRQLRTNVEVDGYRLPIGSYIMAPSYPAHYNEHVWSTPDQPANTFWAERFMHIQPSPGDFYPYGGGVNICPGRLFSRRQILTAVILLLVEFEFEFIRHIDKNGQPAPQGPIPFDIESCGPRGVARPNRDILVQMRPVQSSRGAFIRKMHHNNI